MLNTEEAQVDKVFNDLLTAIVESQTNVAILQATMPNLLFNLHISKNKRTTTKEQEIQTPTCKKEINTHITGKIPLKTKVNSI